MLHGRVVKTPSQDQIVPSMQSICDYPFEYSVCFLGMHVLPNSTLKNNPSGLGWLYLLVCSEEEECQEKKPEPSADSLQSRDSHQSQPRGENKREEKAQRVWKSSHFHRRSHFGREGWRQSLDGSLFSKANELARHQ
jgi:hypothetical protein